MIVETLLVLAAFAGGYGFRGIVGKELKTVGSDLSAAEKSAIAKTDAEIKKIL